ncbi:C-type lectin domain family 4 member E-like isoform X6 [Myxocyprinus asiaticus]|nr:C-type lectin domain family 4 member E-like isoform X6 [Myxocyprinus asiaticus]XP_051527076.1 C-type lectin domain family 4 member E-like isoform X6 [Myxocyprinus asiaticus]XP_051527077.1 C-type lectin domain family 4 member E-like isoform X6 [Myxocyprinus asiaticus]
MSDDVVYSDVIFVKRNGDKRNDTDQCHLGDSSKAMQKTKPCFDCVRLILMAFCILLMGGLIALSFQYVYTERKLKNLQQLHNVLSGNLTGALKDLHHCQQNLSKALNSACPKDWEYHAGKCYLFSTNTLNWTQSRDECVSGGGHLAIINSRDEQKFLMSMLNTTNQGSFWIGLTDEEEEDKWLWVDNTKLSEDERFWIKSEPDNWKGYQEEFPNGEDCAHIIQDNFMHQNLNSWYDAVCSKSFKRICETRSPKQA